MTDSSFVSGDVVSGATTRGPRDLHDARLIVAGRLVSAVAHDLRQPLTAAEMNVAAAVRLLDHITSDKSSPASHSAVSEAGYALSDALLELHRMRESLQVLQDLAGQREPAFRLLSLPACVDDAERLFSSAVSARHVTIHVTHPLELPLVTGDDTLIRQALLNILIDALDAVTDGEPAERSIAIAIREGLDRTVDIAITYTRRRSMSDALSESLAVACSVVHAHGGSLHIKHHTQDIMTTITTRWPIAAGARSEVSPVEALGAGG